MAKVEKVFDAPKEKIWDIVTDRTGKYRRDIESVKETGDGVFVERTYSHQKTTYTELERNPFSRYRVKIKNKKSEVVFTATLEEISPSKTKLILEQTENENRKMMLFSAFFVDTEKILLRYLYEIQKILEHTV